MRSPRPGTASALWSCLSRSSSCCTSTRPPSSASRCWPAPSGTTRTWSSPESNGRPIDKKTDHDDWTGLLQFAGVRYVRLHDDGHNAATLLLSENVHPRVVMELVGHSHV